jgi:hypothetical protein
MLNGLNKILRHTFGEFNSRTISVITIVSGLPRSGTSMMMQMLEAGGLEVVTDNIRKPDEDNPRGYYEFEKVKQINEDAPSWLPSMRGKVCKMVSMLLQRLPSTENYRVIFMERDMNQILASQIKMLKRIGKPNDCASQQEVGRVFRLHLKKIRRWIAVQGNFQVLYVRYSDVINNPRQCAERINAFLGEGLNVDPMVRVVDKSLYRHRL